MTIEFSSVPRFSFDYFGFKNGECIRPIIELSEDEVIIEDASDDSDSSSVESDF